MPGKSKKSGASVVPKGVSAAHAKRLVWKGKYSKTRSGLTKSQLAKNKRGKIVSRAKQQVGKRNKHFLGL